MAKAQNNSFRGGKNSRAFRVFKFFLKAAYLKMRVEGAENIPEEPCIIVGNHCQMNGPLACEFYSPVDRYTWCAGPMLHLKEVPAYAFEDFWSFKPKRTHWFYRILSYAIAPLSVFLFNNANTIEVYRDARVMSTFRASLDILSQGKSIVIFPEEDVPCNNIINNFQEGFVDLARMYHRRSGQEICFVPLYIAPRLKKMYYGKPIRYCASNPPAEEKARICAYLMEEITSIAQNLPWHIVVPYRNIARRFYPVNIPDEVNSK